MKLPLLSVLLPVFLLLGSPPTAQRAAPIAGNWRELGPAPIDQVYAGRISAVVASPSDPNLIYLGGADSGVWRTKDGGSTWVNLTDDLPSTSIGALAMDPGDERVLYAGTGEANYANHSRYGLGLYRSADGGDTWTHLARETFAGRCFARIVVSPDDPDRIYAAVTRAGGFPELAAAKGHPQASGRRGLFRSSDGGASWAPLSLPNLAATDVTLQPGNPDVLLCAVGRIFGDPANGIYRSVDRGDSWTRITAGMPSGSSIGRSSLAYAPSDPSRAYALVTNASSSSGGNASTRGGYRSDDGGQSWSAIPVGNIQSSYGWYLSLVSVDPSDPDVVFMGGLNLRRSLNAGANWSTVTPPHVDMHAAAWDASGRLWIGDDGGVHRTTNRGNTWTPFNAGLGTAQFYAGLSTHPSDARVLLGGTQDNGTNHRSSGGQDWVQVFGGDGGWTQIDQNAPNRHFVEYQGTGNLFRSTNSGGGFSSSSSGINGGDRNCFLPPFLIDPSDSNRMLYATQRVYRSTNGGTSWSAISGDLSNGAGAIRSLAQAPSDPLVIYAATNDGNLQVSTDGGANFSLSLGGRPGWPRVTREIAVHPTDPATAVLATASFGTTQVQITTDLGANWLALDEGLPDVPVNTVGLLPAAGGRPRLVFAGTDTGLFVTPDNGGTWSRFGRGLPNAPVVDILLEPTRNRILVSTQGRGAWSAPLRSSNSPGFAPR